MNDKKARVQVWITREARQALRLLAVKEERELMEQLALCVETFEALQKAAESRGITVKQLIDELERAAVTPPEVPPTNSQDEA